MAVNCKIYNEDCFDTMQKMYENGEHPNIILTSPFYNTNKKANNSVLNDKNKSYVRYDEHIDNYTEEQYRKFMINLFNEYDKVLAWGGGSAI